ncbi:GntR family transcriptional regulator [Ancylobacter sp. A5.8]|uniref:GntR family transcriptional regulator n=1 Tax=Ancylobacter gelatini TaxID=2919920 RepID=UPI001F4E0C26|nr:GntR family transcriptional regulator [Ancylobacter gelatini]MCJ8143335.1 GntR family transcriptional regulator [Ancylobacter gelatini]
MSGITSLEPPKRQSLDRAAADSLRRAILSGLIAPGARLTEAKLAEQFMLSRGTVRAALHRLVAEGLVIQRPYSGWDVLTLTVQDAWELSTLRSSLEALAGRLVAQSIDDAGRAIVMSAYDHLAQAAEEGGEVDLVEADMALHQAIVGLSGHRRLREQYGLIANQLRLYIASSNMLAKTTEAVRDRHHSLIAPLLAGDADAAEAAFRAHAVRSGEEIIAHLERAAIPG